MASRNFPPPPPPADWQAAGLGYYRLSHFFTQRFGARVWKVSVDAGLGCPNRDGTLGRGGCVFCDPASFSPSRRMHGASITEQLDAGIRQLSLAYLPSPVSGEGPG